MKLMIILLCLLLTGCGRQHNAPAHEPVTVPSVSATAPTEPTAVSDPAPHLTYTMYLPDENAEHFVTQTVYTSSITPDSVLEQLQTAGAIPDTIIINAFGAEGEQLNIDFNSSFATAVNATGTSGERMIVGSVVNTFLSAFQVQSVFFTVDGEILESGHVIYDFPLEFIE